MNDSITYSTCFQGQVALVTGASSGIGAEIAVSLGLAGAKVVINCRDNLSGAETVSERIKSAGGESLVCRADASESDDVARMFSEVSAAFGEKIDLLVNNAGCWMDKQPIVECDDEVWDRMFKINCRSMFLCCRTAAKIMIRHGDGAIVNIGSLAGHTGGGGGTIPYAAAKAATHTFTKGLAKELGPFGIRVNGVAPGMIDTPMLTGRVPQASYDQLAKLTPLGRFGKPCEIASAVLYLLSPAASYVTGEIFDVNGGLLTR